MVTSKTLGKIALGLMFPCVGMGFYVQHTVKSKCYHVFKRLDRLLQFFDLNNKNLKKRDLQKDLGTMKL